jgi:hypothetical protein
LSTDEPVSLQTYVAVALRRLEEAHCIRQMRSSVRPFVAPGDMLTVMFDGSVLQCNEGASTSAARSVSPSGNALVSRPSNYSSFSLELLRYDRQTSLVSATSAAAIAAYTLGK